MKTMLWAAAAAVISVGASGDASAKATNEALLERFRPVIYLHPDEQYLPMAVEGYFTGKTTRMVDGGKTLVSEGKVTMQRIYDEYVRRGRKLDGSVHFVNADGVKRGDARPKKGAALRTPVYGVAFEQGGALYLQYAIFYGYNGMYPLTILGVTLKKNLTGAHWGDIEHVTIKLNRARTDIAAMFFAAHGGDDGMRFEGASLKHLEREGKRPVVYSAVNGHGSYPKAGAWVRIATTATDVTGKGLRWDPTLVRIYANSDARFDPKTMGWMYVPGQIGPDGISSLASKDWFVNAAGEKPAFKPMEHYCKSEKDTLCLLKKMGGKAQWAPIAAEIKGALAKNVAEPVKAAANQVKDGARSAAKKVAGGVKSAANKAKDGARSAAKKVAGGAKSAANKVKDGAKKAVKKLKKLFGR